MRRVVSRAAPRLQLVLLFFFAITYCVNILNWIFKVYFVKTDVGDAVISAYLAFSIIGFVAFLFVASPLIYWSYIFADEMAPKTRRNAVSIGIIICFFLHDLPMEWIEVYLLWYYGWRSVISGISFFLVTLCFAVSFFNSWIAYTWFISKKLQLQFSSSSMVMPPSEFMPSSVNYQYTGVDR
ncbi:uncharacterized protein TM35_000121170 [Trypanosoma theileri]|uniref:Uncharacterized protein n=1 Tax=Trypanosoma theileri TaxID=67003 RepID=A0A1X0NXC4_9TRYP|nr:uncharacterized protein TM35_000121170 [Trypanosoma theileri]ORC89342.1 hypothetical protein TM35_000121170 [Trypanosoma theileri]